MFLSRESHTITDSQTIHFLLNFGRVRLLRPFFSAPHTVASAAAVLGLKHSNMAYWITRFLNVGLIEPVESPAETRGKAYRTVAQEFILLPGQGYLAAELYDEQYLPVQERLVKALRRSAEQEAEYWAVRMYLDDLGYLRRDDVPISKLHLPSPVRVQSVNSWAMLRLSAHDYAALQDEMLALLSRYVEQARQDQDSHELTPAIIHMALVKDKGESLRS